MYFANPSSDRLVALMDAGQLGAIMTPAQRLQLPARARWCADNGCYGKGWPGYHAWTAWLRSLAYAADRCAFAVAPDVVGDAAATLARSVPWLPIIRAMGYPAALAAQDGLQSLPVPWDSFDVLFLGGSTEWKLGPHARDLAAMAQRHGKPVHMGRVNTRQRIRLASSWGCVSCDGTTLTRGENRNLPPLLRWLHEANNQTAMEVAHAAR